VSGKAMYTADVIYESGRPRLANEKEILRARAPECTLEAQDFRKNDSELIYTCYRSPFADVFGIDLNTGKTTVYRKIAGEYNEVEGIFPDGQYALVVEPQQLKQTRTTDIWKLTQPKQTSRDPLGVNTRLQGFQPGRRLGRKADGVSVSQSKDPAGVGYGIFVMDMKVTPAFSRQQRSRPVRRLLFVAIARCTRAVTAAADSSNGERHVLRGLLAFRNYVYGGIGVIFRHEQRPHVRPPNSNLPSRPDRNRERQGGGGSAKTDDYAVDDQARRRIDLATTLSGTRNTQAGRRPRITDAKHSTFPPSKVLTGTSSMP
jgi:hypothetical protein